MPPPAETFWFPAATDTRNADWALQVRLQTGRPAFPGPEEGGFLGLFDGLLLNLGREAPNAGILMGTFERGWERAWLGVGGVLSLRNGERHPQPTAELFFGIFDIHPYWGTFGLKQNERQPPKPEVTRLPIPEADKVKAMHE